MAYHLPDLDSPKTTIHLPNPGYKGYNDPTSPFGITEDELRKLYGDSIDSPTYPMEMESLAYCGEPLIRIPKVYPELLWTGVNYTLPYRISDEEICESCLNLFAKSVGKTPEILKKPRIEQLLIEFNSPPNHTSLTPLTLRKQHSVDFCFELHLDRLNRFLKGQITIEAIKHQKGLDDCSCRRN